MEKFYFGKGVLPSFLDELIDRCFGNPLSSDPDTSEWGAAQAGYGWFNTTEGRAKYWDGTQIQTIRKGLDEEVGNYLLFEKDSVYYVKDLSSAEEYDDDTDAANLINRIVTTFPQVFWTLTMKGIIPLNSPIILDGTYFQQGIFTYANIFFDELDINGDNDALILRNIERPAKIRGRQLGVAWNNTSHSKALLKFESVVMESDVEIGFLAGDHTNGKSIGIHVQPGSGGVLCNNKIVIRRPYSVEKVLFMDFSDDAWATVNTFDLGRFEGYSPRQIHLKAVGTANISNNEITGVGGSQDGWNPQGLNPVYAIKMELADSGVIWNTLFRNYRIYSAVDEIYRADAGVLGTTFMAGMPRQDLVAYWHNAGGPIDFISSWTPTSPYYRYTQVTSQAVCIEHHTGADTLTRGESASIHTNLGAGGAILLTLPQDAEAGDYFEFVVMAAQQLQIDPGAAGAVYINGAKQTDDKYVWADDEGESVKLVADGNGDWIAIGAVGTWGVEV